MSNNYLFKFMEKINIKAAEIAKEFEETVYTDPKGAIIRARMFAEEIVKDVFKKEDIDMSFYPTNYDRIVYLSKEGYIEKEMQQALDTIRITGNKAVHEATYSVDIIEAIRMFKMMYRLGVWFTEIYSNDIEIPEHRDPKPAQGVDLNVIQSIIDKAINGKLSQYIQLSKAKEEEEETELNQEEINSNENEPIVLNLPEGKSYLLRELKRLQESSQEAVENANSFSHFKEYMHVERKIQRDLEDVLNKTYQTDRPELILLAGSVGDGKSHLLAYLNENKPDFMEKYTILNDATESFSPNKNALETLSELLDGFSDQKIDLSKKKIILAINLGVLHNFINHSHVGKTFHKFQEFIEDSELFTEKVTTKYSKNSFHLIGFSDYQPYELTENGPTSSFFSGILSKVFSKETNNPFYLAYQEDLKRNVKGVIHENFEFLMNENVQKEIIQLVIQGIIRNKLVISTRAFYNFVADLIIPESYTELSDFGWNYFEKLNQTVPYLLFKRRDRSNILKTMAQLDPIHTRSQSIDQIIIEVNTLSDWAKLVVKWISNPVAISWLEPFTTQNGDDLNTHQVTNYSYFEFSQALIRLSYLTNTSFAENTITPSYKAYMRYLYHFNRAYKRQIEVFYKEIIETIFKWRGSPKNGYIYINKPNEKYRIAQELSFKPSMDHLTSKNEEILTSFKQTLSLVFYGAGNNQQRVDLEIDYPLYALLSSVQNGYCPNKKDEEDAIKFVEFLERIMKFGKKNEELLIHIPTENKYYTLSKGFFGGYVFERE